MTVYLQNTTVTIIRNTHLLQVDRPFPIEKLEEAVPHCQHTVGREGSQHAAPGLQRGRGLLQVGLCVRAYVCVCECVCVNSLVSITLHTLLKCGHPCIKATRVSRCMHYGTNPTPEMKPHPLPTCTKIIKGIKFQNSRIDKKRNTSDSPGHVSTHVGI